MINLPASLIEEMIGLADSEGWAFIDKALDERLTNLQRNLIQGKLDHEEYVRVCAAIRELEYVRGLPRALLASAHVRTGVASVHS